MPLLAFLRTYLQVDVHLAGVVEHGEGVERGSELVVYRLVGDLEGTDVLKTLFRDAFTVSLSLIEVYRLLDALDVSEYEPHDDAKQHDADDGL